VARQEETRAVDDALAGASSEITDEDPRNGFLERPRCAVS
jgi:hypothetical protein